MPARKKHHALILLALAVLVLAAAVARLYVGQVRGWPQGHLPGAVLSLFFGDWLERTPVTIMSIRVAHVLVAIVAGVALSTSGVALQALLRNPLAEPFVLGLAGGAAVGYQLQQLLRKPLDHPIAPLHLGALAGAVGTLAIVYFAGRRRGVIDPLGILLTGVVVSAMSGAAIMILFHFNTQGDQSQLARWMQGYLQENPGSLEMLTVTGLTFAGLALLTTQANAMDAALFNDEEAISLGVNLARLRATLFIAASVLAAGAVVLVGPLAFVGLVCPHLARLLFGPGHRTLLIAAPLLGALLLLIGDTVVALVQIAHFPLGVFTALVGGPVFLMMLRKRMGAG